MDLKDVLNTVTQQGSSKGQYQTGNQSAPMSASASCGTPVNNKKLFEALSFNRQRLVLDFIRQQWGIELGDETPEELVYDAFAQLVGYNKRLVEEARQADIRRLNRAVSTLWYSSQDFAYLHALPGPKADEAIENSRLCLYDGDIAVTYHHGGHRQGEAYSMAVSVRPMMYGPIAQNQYVHAIAEPSTLNGTYHLCLPQDIYWVERGKVVASGCVLGIVNEMPVRAGDFVIVQLMVSCQQSEALTKLKVEATVDDHFTKLLAGDAWRFKARPSAKYKDMYDGRPLRDLPAVLERVSFDGSSSFRVERDGLILARPWRKGWRADA